MGDARRAREDLVPPRGRRLSDLSDPPALAVQVENFAREVADVLSAVFPDVPQVVTSRLDDRFWIELTPRLPLRVGESELAALDVSMRCCSDSSGRWLALEKSAVKLTALLDRTPILRFEYERNAQKIPSAHVQVHAHRGALSHLLSQAGHKSPHSIEALHLPVGGPRFRPALEDVVEFLVSDCGFASRPGWRDAVEVGRERFRRTQLRSAVRDAPEDAAQVLRDLGYSVTSPGSGPASDNTAKLRAW